MRKPKVAAKLNPVWVSSSLELPCTVQILDKHGHRFPLFFFSSLKFQLFTKLTESYLVISWKLSLIASSEYKWPKPWEICIFTQAVPEELWWNRGESCQSPWEVPCKCLPVNDQAVLCARPTFKLAHSSLWLIYSSERNFWRIILCLDFLAP